MRRLIVLIAILIILLGLISYSQRFLPSVQQYISGSTQVNNPAGNEKVKVVTEESITVDIAKKAGQSVVTISEHLPQQSQSRQSPFDFGPFSIFGFPDQPDQGQSQSPDQSEPQSIGSGFLISGDGLIVTNKHVVSDTQGKYTVVTSDDKKYDVQKIYRDPLNDIAILKIDPGQNAGNLKTIELGDSSKLQVGQYAIAIGTALGEFRNTVTTGVISGLGRGISAGSPYEGSVERLDNVIQTSAAINPGNSGGPLLNSSGQVIGVNTAVSSSGQNIGFAIPINTIKDSLKNFNETGKFDRPYLGVAYKLISRDIALLNDLPEGAYVQQVVQGSPADKAGIKRDDIIIKIDGQRINTDNQLSAIISKKKIGDTMTVTVFRDNNSQDLQVTLEAAPAQ